MDRAKLEREREKKTNNFSFLSEDFFLFSLAIILSKLIDEAFFLIDFILTNRLIYPSTVICQHHYIQLNTFFIPHLFNSFFSLARDTVRMTNTQHLVEDSKVLMMMMMIIAPSIKKFFTCSTVHRCRLKKIHFLCSIISSGIVINSRIIRIEKCGLIRTVGIRIDVMISSCLR